MYQVAYGEEHGREVEEYSLKSQAIKRAQALQKAGHANIYVDRFGRDAGNSEPNNDKYIETIYRANLK